MKTALYLSGTAILAAAAVILAHAAPVAAEGAANAMVQPDGSIVMTKENYARDWSVLGVFAHLDDAGVKQFNVVYTQPETVIAYQQTGEFPEGAVLIKELRDGVTEGDGDDRTSHLGALKGWFAMIKPPRENGPQGPLWGDGWGWAKFNADAPDATITTNYEQDCLGCHMPVKATDWVHIQAYPMLRD